jgi:hypothetical protein
VPGPILVDGADLDVDDARGETALAHLVLVDVRGER